VKFTPIQHSLRLKIFLRCTLLVGLTLIATGSFSILIARSSIRERTIQDLLFLSEEQTKTITHMRDTHRSIAKLLASDADISAFMEGRKQESQTRQSLLRKQDFSMPLRNIALLSPEGKVLVSTDSQMEGKDVSTQEYVRWGQQRTYGPLQILEARRTYLVATPIRSDEGVLRGILLGEFSLDDLYRSLSDVKRLGTTGEFLLLEPEEHGGFCANPRQSVFSVNSALSSVLRSATGSQEARFSRPTQGMPSLLCSLAASGKEGLIAAKDERGHRVLAAHSFLQDIRLGVIAKVDEEEIFRPVRLLVAVLIGTTCILLLLVIFIALRLSHDVVDPIIRLRKSLCQLNTGHWQHTRSVFTGDELEVLDVETKRLAARLKEAYSSLEERVKERTQELAEDHAKDEALLESIGEGFFAVNMSGKIITANRSAEQMLHWNREQILNAHFSSVLNLRAKDGTLLAPNEHFIQKAILEKATIKTAAVDTVRCERKDGTLFPIAITARPFLMGMEMRGVVVTFRDVTEEKRIDRMKSEFISLASHQLRTPLTAIGWYVELMQGDTGELTHDQQDYLAQIIESHKRMVDLVNSLLNVSRIELGRLRIDPEETTIEKIVSAASTQLELQMEQKQLTFSKRFPAKLKVFIDMRLVQMVLENLISNAVKYTANGGSIDLSVLSDGRELRFEVRDSGMGIPQTQKERIFEKLFRADNVLKTDTEGTGIGLYIAKYTAEAWGGRLWFESEENKGTTFFFTTPIRMKKVGAETTNGATANIEKDSSSPLSK
jgi:PAS domain S-box-containing protein